MRPIWLCTETFKDTTRYSCNTLSNTRLISSIKPEDRIVFGLVFSGKIAGKLRLPYFSKSVKNEDLLLIAARLRKKDILKLRHFQITADELFDEWKVSQAELYEIKATIC